MNWNLVWWFFGIMATFTALKFIVVVFKSLFNKETMSSMLDCVGDKVNNINKRMTEKIKETAEKKKAEKIRKKYEEEKPIVLIR